MKAGLYLHALDQLEPVVQLSSVIQGCWVGFFYTYLDEERIDL